MLYGLLGCHALHTHLQIDNRKVLDKGGYLIIDELLYKCIKRELDRCVGLGTFVDMREQLHNLVSNTTACQNPGAPPCSPLTYLSFDLLMRTRQLE